MIFERPRARANKRAQQGELQGAQVARLPRVVAAVEAFLELISNPLLFIIIIGYLLIICL